MENKCIALFFSLMILGQAYLVRKFVGTWLFPACVFGLFWFLITFIPLAVLLFVPIDPLGIGFIFLCLLAFSCSAFVINWNEAFKKNLLKSGPRDVYKGPLLTAAFYIIAFASMLLIILNSLVRGISLSDLMLNLIASAAAYRETATATGFDVNIFERLGVICTYLTMILGGLRIPYAATKSSRIAIITIAFIPSILMALAQSAKWYLLLGAVLFYAGILIHRICNGSCRLLGTSKKPLIFSAATLLIIVALSFMSRGELYEMENSDLLASRMTSYLASYSSGHIYAFSDWFAFDVVGNHSTIAYSHETAPSGFYTFATIFKALGIDRELPIGVFDDYYSNEDLLTTNVYTMFRGLILDFGLPGSMLFMFAIGLLFHGAFYALLTQKAPIFPAVVFFFMMAFFFGSFMVSLLGSNSIYYVTFALLWMILHANKIMARQHASSQSYS